MKERLFWGFVCAVSLLASGTVSLLCLWAGLRVGITIVKTISLHFTPPPDWLSTWIPEELLQSVDGLVSVTPAIIAVLAIMRGAASDWFAAAFGSLKCEIKKLWKAGDPSNNSERSTRATVLLALIKPGAFVFCAGVVLGSAGSFGTTIPSPVTYVFPDSTLNVLPIHPVVHFDNAEVDSSFELTDRGTTLNDARRVSLTEFVQKLRRCATSKRPVTITLYGFASDDPFVSPDIDQAKSDELNVQAANRRAWSVYDALTELISELIEPEEPGGMTVEEPTNWDTFADMARTRDLMIRFPAGTDRDPFADRVVVLHLTSFGTCRPVD